MFVSFSLKISFMRAMAASVGRGGLRAEKREVAFELRKRLEGPSRNGCVSVGEVDCELHCELDCIVNWNFLLLCSILYGGRDILCEFLAHAKRP